MKTKTEVLQDLAKTFVPLGSIVALDDGRLAVVDAIDPMWGTVTGISFVQAIKEGKEHGGVEITRSSTSSDDAEGAGR